MPAMTWKARGPHLTLVLGLCVLGGAAGAVHAQSTLSLPAQVGAQLFHDTNLSASKALACATRPGIPVTYYDLGL
jgi:cytochrome c peroxidase